jgi:DNA-binding MarR family transcriptional regulator
MKFENHFEKPRKNSNSTCINNGNLILSNTQRKLLTLIAINKEYSQKTLAEIIQKSPSTVSYNLEKLKKLDLIREIPYDTCKIHILTERGKNQWKILSSKIPTRYDGKFEITDKAHKLKFHSTWTAPREIRKEIENTWSSDKDMGWKRYQEKFKDYNVMFSPNYVTITLKKFYAPVKDAESMAFEKANKIIHDLEKTYPGLRIGTPKCTMRILTQEHAIQEDPFARWCVNSKIYIDNYKDRVTIDASDGTPEIDFISNRLSYEDAVKYADHIVSLVDGSETIPSTEEWGAVRESIMQISGVLPELARQMELHLEVMNDMKESQRETLNTQREITMAVREIRNGFPKKTKTGKPAKVMSLINAIEELRNSRGAKE